ncbi:hypothetical protein ACIP79_26165 [Streptomyces sp. NPDC088747]|uniref:hypothetical protein n=1 Tax=Streptomyces sp. NPDC088747 TaxID=3365886 RepID=UPI0037FEEDBA
MYRRPLRLCCGALAAGLLLAGCSGAEDRGPRGAGSEPADAKGGAPSSPSPSAASLNFTPDPGRAPNTRAEAERLVRIVGAAPVDLGPGYVKRSPYQSEPGFWPVLDANCVWQREPLPDTALASLTRYMELPAEDGKGPIRVAAVVTVHPTVVDAEWEMAETLEEALRCPDQQLRQGERITGLLSQGADFGLMGNFTSEDTLTEAGEYYSDQLGGPHYYYWVQSRLSQVTVAVVGKGAKGRSDDDVDAALLQGVSQMLSRAEIELEAPE